MNRTKRQNDEPDSQRPDVREADRIFWAAMRRALLAMVRAIEVRWGNAGD